MGTYTEMIWKLNECLECNSSSAALGILGSDLYFAIFGTYKTSKINTRVSDSNMWNRQKVEIRQFKHEIFHDGDNIFRVVVHMKHNESHKIFPVRKRGSVNELMYSFAGHSGQGFEIWISLLSGSTQHIQPYYTEWGKTETKEEELEITRNFSGEKIACLHFTDDDEFDVYRITNRHNQTILKMTFGLKPIPTQEIEPVEEIQEIAPVEEMQEIAPVEEIMHCVTRQGHSCKCFLVPEVKCKVDSFRSMAGWNVEEHVGHNAHNNFELTTTTTNHVKVYIECPVDCTVSLWHKDGSKMSSCRASANQRTYVGTTTALEYNAFEMGMNAYHISIVDDMSIEGQDFPFFVQLGAPGVLSQTQNSDHAMGREHSVKFLLNKFLQI